MKLQKVLKENNIDFGKTTINKCRHDLGWTYRGSAYCQMIRDQNKIKRFNGLKKTWVTASSTVFIQMNNRATGDTQKILWYKDRLQT